MKILHILSCPASGGAEVYVKDLAIAFARQGEEVCIAFLSSANDQGRNEDFERKFLEQLESQGVKYFFIGNGARRFPWQGRYILKKNLGENRYDVIHSHLLYGLSYSSGLGVPLIYTHHSEKISSKGKLTFRYASFKLLQNFVDSFVAISEECRSYLSQCTNKDIELIRNAVDSSKFEPFKRQARSSKIVNAICVGRLSEQKNYPLLIKAVSLLSDYERSLIKIKVVGEGADSYRAFLLDMVEKLEVSDVFEFVGNSNDVPQVLSESSLFLMSSAFEGLPIALIEAAMSGLPAIVTNVGGCKEVIDNCDNGVVVPPNDVEAMSKAISFFLHNQTVMEKYSENAVANSYVFGIEEAAKLHLSLYRKFV